MLRHAAPLTSKERRTEQRQQRHLDEDDEIDVALQEIARVAVPIGRKPLDAGDDDDGARQSHRDEEKREGTEMALPLSGGVLTRHGARSGRERADQREDAVVSMRDGVREIPTDVPQGELPGDVGALSAGPAEPLAVVKARTAVQARACAQALTALSTRCGCAMP